MTSSQKLKSSLLIAIFGLSATLTFVPAEAQVSTTANGPYYATPSWDQKITTGRFVVLSNWNDAAVLDRETGLVWDRSPIAATFSWVDAQLFCNEVTTGNRLGWRLPTYQELASLVDLSVPTPGPRLPAGHPFPTVQPTEYWSATTTAVVTGGAWALNFSAAVRRRDVQSSLKLVWCVRGGQGSDPQ